MDSNNLTQFRGKVRALSNKGLGVVDHPDGRIFFVRGGWPEEVGTFEVPAGAKNYSEVMAIEWHETSPGRVEIACPHYGALPGKCGGCPWMGMSYETQLKAKETRLNFILAKNEIKSELINPILGSTQEFGYRNRAQFKTEGNEIGYVSEGTNQLAPIEDCIILNDKMRILLKGLQGQLPNTNWKPTKGFPWSYLEVDDAMDIRDVVPNRRRPFRQGNTSQNEAMKKWIKQEISKLPKAWPVVEAFCGSGNFTEVISESGHSSILAAEIRGSAIDELKAKNIPGVRVLEIDMNEKNVWKRIASMQPDAKVLLVDPPREGMETRRDLMKNLSSLEVILYISCELTTWARDVKDLIKEGWKVKEVTPLDLFPHTPHVELLSVLVKS